jgi:hypothetical protein
MSLVEMWPWPMCGVGWRPRKLSVLGSNAQLRSENTTGKTSARFKGGFMKIAMWRFGVVVAAIAAVVVLGGRTTAWAQCPASPNYVSDFSSDQSCLTLNPAEGTTPQFVVTGEPSHTVLRLTTNTPNQVGSAWFNTLQPVQKGFSTSFQFQFTGMTSPPADGHSLRNPKQ